MAAGDERLWDICDRAGATSHLSAEDLAYAETHLASSLPGDRANACEAILRCSRSQAQRAKAVKTLEALCLISEDELHVMTLLTALMYARKDVYFDLFAFRQFVMQSSRSPKHYLRANAIDLVEALAKGGDREALELLKSLAKDEYETVRSNAVISLTRVGE